MKHAQEFTADTAGQAGTAGILSAASEQLHQESRTYLPHQHYQVLPTSRPDVPCYSYAKRHGVHLPL